MGQAATVIMGAPGTGKTQRLLKLAQQHLKNRGSSGLLVLTPSRISATRFRQELAAKASTTLSAAPIRAWQAYAFDLLRRGHTAGLLPGLRFAPQLLSGPEQDVILAQLLEGHRQGIGQMISWPADLELALGTAGFRHEIRDLFDRMAEYNLSADQLRQLGQEAKQPAWLAAAQLYTEYRQVCRLRMPNAFDPAALINRAAQLLEKNPDFLAAERAQLKLVLIDDFQEASPAIYRLLGLLCGQASSPQSAPETKLTLCTDTLVQGFRGARVDLLQKLPATLGQLNKEQLKTSYRMPADLARAWSAVASRLPLQAGFSHNRSLEQQNQQAAACEEDKNLLTLTVDSPQLEARLLTQMILEDHLYRGKDFNRSVIIVRNSATVTQLKSSLEQQGIPVATSAALTPLRDQPAVRPFLDALKLILATDSQDNEQLEERAGEQTSPEMSLDLALALLTSRLGGASAMDIRRLRQELRAQELQDGGRRSSDQLLVQAIMDPSQLPKNRATAAAYRLNRVLSAGQKALKQTSASAETVLWELWQASGLAKEWRELSLQRGPLAQRANRDLDAMISLFEAAARYLDQMPGASPAQFLDYIAAQDLPMDSLITPTYGGQSLEIMTPAQAAGRQWETVYVAGLQEGSWPNTTVRGTLLNTQYLTDILDVGRQQADKVSMAERVRQTRYDELRMFCTAVSRASQRLVCTAVSSAEQAPSEFLDILAPSPEGQRHNTRVGRPMTLRSFIAELRRWVQAQDQDPARAHAAAKILHRLDQEGKARQLQLPGVHPSSWWGLLELSSTEAAFGPDAQIPLSPSRIQQIHKSPLNWFVSQSRAEPASDLARSIGTLVHEIAEDLPDWPENAQEQGQSYRNMLLDQLKIRFPRLGLPDTWETRLIYQRAENMLSKFSDYVADLHTGKQRQLVGVEGSFSVEIPGPRRVALLQGRVDRLEKLVGQERYVIVDLKTGKNQPSKKELEKHPQLAAYQVALEAGAGPAMEASMKKPSQQPQQELTLTGLQDKSGGAYLVQLGRDTKSYGQQEQGALSPEAQWALDLLNRAAELISQSHYQARHDSATSSSQISGCQLPDICPLCSRGRQVTQS